MRRKILHTLKNVGEFLLLWFMISCTILTVWSAAQYLAAKYEDDIAVQTVYHVEVREITI